MPLMKRGIEEVILSAAGTGVTGAAFTLPSEMMGARLAWAVQSTANPQTTTLQGTVDGVNWFQLDQSTTATGELRVVIAQGVKAIRAVTGTITGGTVTVTARAT